jgi:hypothetical protein
MMQFLVIAFVAMVFLALVATVLFLIVSALAIAGVAAVIGLPLWFMAKHWKSQRRVPVRTQSPIERLKNLYVEGKIDLFEFERAVAHLVHVEH